MRYYPPIEERLYGRSVVTDSGCIEYQGSDNGQGYGRLWYNGKNRSAHSVAWELANGPVPDGLILRHFICDNPPCINTEHLRLGTLVDNMADRKAHGRVGVSFNGSKTHCPKKHSYKEHGFTQCGNARACRLCVNDNQRRRRNQA